MSELIEAIAGQFDRLPPHSIESEQCVLASMLLDHEMIGEIASVLSREEFFQVDHQIIFDLIIQLWKANKPVDAVLLREELVKRNLLEEIGGVKYLVSLYDTVPSAAHGLHYAKLVHEKYLVRQVIAASNESLRDAYSCHQEALEIVNRAEVRIFDIVQQNACKATYEQSVGDGLAQAYAHIEAKELGGLVTGFYDLDDMLTGVHGGEFVIVAARPSIGKTALAMDMARGICNLNPKGTRAGFFSLEMNMAQLCHRMLCGLAGVDSTRARRGMLNATEYAEMSRAAEENAGLEIIVDSAASLSAIEFRTRARRMKAKHGVSVIFLDYIGLMSSGRDRDENKNAEVTQISKMIKATARELDIPIIVLSQLNRLSESRGDHRPRLSDLRDSGSLEQDADVVLLLHREDYYRMGEPDFIPDNMAEIIVAKQRCGPTGVVKLVWNPKCTRFQNFASEHQSAIPDFD